MSNVNTQKISNHGSNRRFLVTKMKPSNRELRTQERRRQRKKLQFFMRKSCEGAQSVLNDDYGEEQKPFPHERLLEYWRQMFS